MMITHLDPVLETVQNQGADNRVAGAEHIEIPTGPARKGEGL
jgi:hypothetical protein